MTAAAPTAAVNGSQATAFSQQGSGRGREAGWTDEEEEEQQKLRWVGLGRGEEGNRIKSSGPCPLHSRSLTVAVDDGNATRTVVIRVAVGQLFQAGILQQQSIVYPRDKWNSKLCYYRHTASQSSGQCHTSASLLL